MPTARTHKEASEITKLNWGEITGMKRDLDGIREDLAEIKLLMAGAHGQIRALEEFKIRLEEQQKAANQRAEEKQAAATKEQADKHRRFAWNLSLGMAVIKIVETGYNYMQANHH